MLVFSSIKEVICGFTYTKGYKSYLHSAKLSTHHIIVTSCFLGGPRKSSFILCSRIHTTVPTIMKKAAVTAHIHGVNGRKNAQALENFLTGATTTSPDSA